MIFRALKGIPLKMVILDHQCIFSGEKRFQSPGDHVRRDTIGKMVGKKICHDSRLQFVFLPPWQGLKNPYLALVSHLFFSFSTSRFWLWQRHVSPKFQLLYQFRGIYDSNYDCTVRKSVIRHSEGKGKVISDNLFKSSLNSILF